VSVQSWTSKWLGSRPRISAALIGAAFLLSYIGLSAPAHAQSTYPSQPIRFIVTNPAGGLPDTVARIYGRHLEQRLGQPIIIENRGGGNGTIGINSMLSYPPDGYAFVVTDGAVYSVNPLIQANISYKESDIKPAGLLAISPLFLAAHPKVGVKTLPELIAYAREHQGQLNYGSSGVGSAHHLSMVAFLTALKLNMTHVPFKGTGESVPALLGGHVDLLFSAYPSLSGAAEAKQVNLLATASGTRSSLEPNLPSISEVIPDYDYKAIIGLFSHAQTPQAVLDKIATEIAAIAKDPDVVQRLKVVGAEAAGYDGKGHLVELQKERKRYEPLLDTVGLKLSAR